MPAKYSHIKKRTPNPKKNGKGSGNGSKQVLKHRHPHHPNPHADRSVTQAMSAVTQLERAISRILLLRYEQDIARLFSTRLHDIALVHLPTFVMRCVTLGGPSWAAHNADCEEIKDFFRAAISMDMRQAGERVATKSVLWSYTALRHFAMSNNVTICQKRGLHSMRLLPHYLSLKGHLDVLEALPPPVMSKPPHLGSLKEGIQALEEACEHKYARWSQVPPEWQHDWRPKVRLGYEKVTQTLWRVAREFDVRGYGQVLREKLSTKWCDCGCSTDHLGEVCEKTVREDEEESGVRSGKQREWDGRGSGIFGWETEEEEDIWELELDFSGMDPEDLDEGIDPSMTIGEIMEWRFLKAEREKEQGNTAFRRGLFDVAITHYQAAHKIEPELPHYQLNLAAAYLKLNNWIEAEKACTKALSQHRSGKGYFRRARARRMLGKTDDAIRDLRAILRFQPSNNDAITELLDLLPPDTNAPTPSSSSADQQYLEHLHGHLGIAKPKSIKSSPFLRVPSDSQKLKIVILPTNDVPIWEHHHEVTEKGKQKLTMTMKTNLTPREAEMQKLRRENTAYPSWDRYVVKKA